MRSYCESYLRLPLLELRELRDDDRALLLLLPPLRPDERYEGELEREPERETPLLDEDERLEGAS